MILFEKSAYEFLIEIYFFFIEPSRRKNFIQENVKSLRKMEQYFHNKNIEDLKNLHLHKQQKAVNKYQNITSKVNSTFKVGEVTGNKSYSNLQGRSKTEKLSSSCKKLNGGDVYCKDASLSCSKKLSKSHEMYNSMPQGIGKPRQVQRVPISKNKFKSNENIVRSQFESSEMKKNDVKLRNQGVQTMDDNKLENLYTEGVIRYLFFYLKKKISIAKAKYKIFCFSLNSKIRDEKGLEG